MTYLLGLSLGSIVNKDDTLCLLPPLFITLLSILLLLLEPLSLFGHLGFLLPPSLDDLDQLLLGTGTELDPFIPLHTIWLSDHEVGDCCWSCV